MSEVTVQFFGICMHVTLANADKSHRVILVNASSQRRINEHRLLAEHNVKPHFARLQLERGKFSGEVPDWFPVAAESQDAIAWALDGAVLSFDGAFEARPESSGSASCIPSLSAYTNDRLVLRGHYGEAEQSVTACFVDLPPVTVTGRNWELGAAVGVVQLSFPGRPTITVTPFDHRTPAFQLDLEPGTAVTVSNYPKVMTPVTEKDPDFLLHFLATSHVPAEATYPTSPTGCPNTPPLTNPPIVTGAVHGHGMSGPGCSNSTYP
jgi:hypothetical protein